MRNFLKIEPLDASRWRKKIEKMGDALVYYPIECLVPDADGSCELDEKVDVWRLGVVLFYMTTLEMPLKEKKIDKLMSKFNNEQLELTIDESKFSQDLVELMRGLLKIKAIERPLVREILKNNFVREAIIGQSGGRGWTAFNREEMAIIEQMNEEKKLKTKENIDKLRGEKMKVLFDDDYDFENAIVSQSWFTQPTGSPIVALLIVNPPWNLAIAVSANGQITVFYRFLLLFFLLSL